MAEKDGSSSNKSSDNNSDNEELSDSMPPNQAQPDLGIADIRYPSSSQDDSGLGDCGSTASKPSSASRKEDSPFSLRHFLKRDLSLPGSSSSDNSVRPKVYSSTQHSPTRENMRKSRSIYSPCSSHQDNSFYRQNAEALPSLPDFVQDHLLVEQAYSNNDCPLSVDLENLPDFTLSDNQGVRNNYDGYQQNVGRQNNESSPSPNPMDLHVHLNLDLTESVNSIDRRSHSPLNNFPLDLPSNAVAAQAIEAMRLPDFLPDLTGRQSPESPDAIRELERVTSEFDNTRSELIAERSRSQRLASELESALILQDALREELRTLRQLNGPSTSHSSKINKSENTSCDVIELRKQIDQLQDELLASRLEIESLREERIEQSNTVNRSVDQAEVQLREVLETLERLKSTNRNPNKENT